MQPKSGFTMLSLVLAGVVMLSSAAWSTEEPELVIVKYGSLQVSCSEPGARVYVDENYKGSAGSIIESISVGEHQISCKTEDKTVSGTFSIKKNETLKLEADLEGGKLAPLHDAAKQQEKTPEVVAEKKKQEPARNEKPRKPEPKKAEPKKVDQKNPVEERRKSHLNVMKIKYGVSDTQEVRFDHAADQHVISKFSVKKHTTGKYYRTKQGVLLCDAGPCEITWSATFVYTDETGKSDALLMNWRKNVFNGITPAGTSRQDLECCLNGQCWKMQENTKGDESQEFEVGRFRLGWTPSSVVLRRSDIMQEVIDAGRSLDDY